MQALEDTARARGLAELIGLVLKDNDEMGDLMRKRGYGPHRDEEDPGILRYIKPLTESAGRLASRRRHGLRSARLTRHCADPVGMSALSRRWRPHLQSTTLLDAARAAASFPCRY